MWVFISNMNTNPNSEGWVTVYIHILVYCVSHLAVLVRHHWRRRSQCHVKKQLEFSKLRKCNFSRSSLPFFVRKCRPELRTTFETCSWSHLIPDGCRLWVWRRDDILSNSGCPSSSHDQYVPIELWRTREVVYTSFTHDTTKTVPSGSTRSLVCPTKTSDGQTYRE